MKPAREPASNRPKPCASLKKPHESCPSAAPCGPRRKKNDGVVRLSFSLRNLPGRAFDSRAQGSSHPLGRQRSSCPAPSPNLVRTHLIDNYQALHGSDECLSRAATLPKGTKLELGRGAHLGTPSSYRRRVSTDRPNREGSQLAASLEGELGPTPAGKTLPHSYRETTGFEGRGHECSGRRSVSCHTRQPHLTGLLLSTRSSALYDSLLVSGTVGF